MHGPFKTVSCLELVVKILLLGIYPAFWLQEPTQGEMSWELQARPHSVHWGRIVISSLTQLLTKCKRRWSDQTR